MFYFSAFSCVLFRPRLFRTLVPCSLKTGFYLRELNLCIEGSLKWIYYSSYFLRTDPLIVEDFKLNPFRWVAFFGAKFVFFCFWFFLPFPNLFERLAEFLGDFLIFLSDLKGFSKGYVLSWWWINLAVLVLSKSLLNLRFLEV